MNRYKQIARTFILPAFAAAVLVASGCGKADGAEQKEEENPLEQAVDRAVRVETMVIRPTAFQDVLELTGTVEATNDATLSAQSAGTVVGLVERGQYVKAGQTVAQLDAGIARASVQAAEAQVAAAQSNYDLQLDNLKRLEPLFKDSVISAIEYERTRAGYNNARAQLNQAQAGLAQAKEALGNTTVRAPFPGMVEERLVERGEQVMPGRQLVRIVNTGLVKVTAGVPERYAGDIRTGIPVTVDFTSAGAGTRSGRVTFVGSAVNPQSRTFPIEVAIENGNGQLKPAMVARVLAPRDARTDALVVPRTAVLKDEKGTSVYVAVRSGNKVTAERREVVLGPAYGENAVVTSGLKAGDEVIVMGQNSVAQGDALEIAERRVVGTPVAAR